MIIVEKAKHIFVLVLSVAATLFSGFVYSAETFVGNWDLDGTGQTSSVYFVTSGFGTQSEVKIVSLNGSYLTFPINGSSFAILANGVQDLDGVPGAEIALSSVNSQGSFINIINKKRNTLRQYLVGSQVSWSNIAVDDFDGLPGAEIVISVVSNSIREYRFIKNRGGEISNNRYQYSSSDSIVILTGGKVNVDDKAGKELVINKNGNTIEVIHDSSQTRSQYFIGAQIWSLIGYSDLNGVTGSEIVVKQDRVLKVVNNITKNVRTFDVGTANLWAFSRFENVDGNPGNEIIVNLSGTPKVIAYGSEVVVAGALRHVGGLCIHPEGGSATPANGTPAVLWSGCTDQRLKFKFLPDGSIQHLTSGLCLHPEGGSSNPDNWTRLVFWQGCNDARLRFDLLPDGNLRHRASGKCIHPAGGSATPEIGTPVVFWDICGESRLRFEHLLFN